MDANNFVVYKLVHKTSGAFYVGATCRLNSRRSRHFSELKRACHHNCKLQALVDYTKPVADQFDFIVVAAKLSETAACEMEQVLIKQSSLNIQQGSRGGDALTQHPQRLAIKRSRHAEQIKRLTQMSKIELSEMFGRPGSTNPMFGKTHTAEARLSISKANKGVTRRKGFKLSEDHCRKIAVNASKRTGAKNPFFGCTHSAETRQQLAKANKGRKPINSRRVTADGIEFESVRAAARHFDVTPALIIYRIKSDRWSYDYCVKCLTTTESH